MKEECTFKDYDPENYKNWPNVSYTISVLEKEIVKLTAETGNKDAEKKIIELKNTISFLKEYK